MWKRQRFRSARQADDFAAAMFDVGYTTYSGSCPVIPDGCKFFGFTWGESREGQKVIIFTPAPEVYATWTWAMEIK